MSNRYEIMQDESPNKRKMIIQGQDPGENNIFFTLMKFFFYLLLVIILIIIPALLYTISRASINATVITFGPLLLKRDFSIGDLFTALSLLGSAYIFVFTWLDNEKQKRISEANKHREDQEAYEKEYLAKKQEYEKDYADKVRNSAAVTIAKLDRWKELNLHVLDRSSLIFETADSTLAQNKDSKDFSKSAKDIIWNGITEAHASMFSEIVNEGIEIAYRDLYGYEPKIEKLFTDTIEILKYIDRRIFQIFLITTQNDVKWTVERAEIDISANALGNELRKTTNIIRLFYKDLMNCAIAPFRAEMIKLIGYSDEVIFTKRFPEGIIYTKNMLFTSDQLDGICEGYKYALTGLDLCYSEEYIRAIRCFEIASDLSPYVPGFLAGKSLAYRILAIKTNANEKDLAEMELALKEALNLESRLLISS